MVFGGGFYHEWINIIFLKKLFRDTCLVFQAGFFSSSAEVVVVVLLLLLVDQLMMKMVLQNAVVLSDSADLHLSLQEI